MKFSSIIILYLLKIEFAWCVKCFNEFKYLSNLHCYFFQILTFISIAIRVKVLSWNNNWADTFQLLIKPFKTSTKYLTVSARVNEFYCCYIDKILSELWNWSLKFRSENFNLGSHYNNMGRQGRPGTHHCNNQQPLTLAKLVQITIHKSGDWWG